MDNPLGQCPGVILQPPVRLFCLDVREGDTLRSMEKLEVHVSAFLLSICSQKSQGGAMTVKKGKSLCVPAHCMANTTEDTASTGTQDS